MFHPLEEPQLVEHLDPRRRAADRDRLDEGPGASELLEGRLGVPQAEREQLCWPAESLKDARAPSAGMHARRRGQMFPNRAEQLLETIRPGFLMNRDEEGHTVQPPTSRRARPSTTGATCYPADSIVRGAIIWCDVPTPALKGMPRSRTGPLQQS